MLIYICRTILLQQLGNRNFASLNNDGKQNYAALVCDYVIICVLPNPNCQVCLNLDGMYINLPLFVEKRLDDCLDLSFFLTSCLHPDVSLYVYCPV